MSEDSSHGSSEASDDGGPERVVAALTELDRQREEVEKDQVWMRRTGEIALPLVSLIAVVGFVAFTVLVALFLNVSTATYFSYAIVASSFLFSGTFGVLAALSRRALTQSQFTFLSVFNKKTAEAVKKLYPEFEKGLDETKTVAVKGPRPVAESELARPVIELFTREQNKAVPKEKRRFHGVSLLAFASVILMAASLGLTFVMIQKSYLLADTALNQISIIGLALLVISYLAFLSMGRQSAEYLHEPRIWSTRQDILNYVDYLFGMFPIRIRTGDSRQVQLRFFRVHPACSIKHREYLEAEIQAAGVEVSGEKKLRLPDCFTTQNILWSCRFPHTGKHTVTLSLNKVEPKKSTKDVVYATDFTTEVVSPFRASMQTGATVVISAMSALAALSTALHIHLW